MIIGNNPSRAESRERKGFLDSGCGKDPVWLQLNRTLGIDLLRSGDEKTVGGGDEGEEMVFPPVRTHHLKAFCLLFGLTSKY